MSTIQVREYDLPDSYLYRSNIQNKLLKVWIPNENYIVLGRSNTPNNSLFVNNIIEDGIPVFKRPSGGETVLLTPNTIVISLAIRQSNFKGGKTYFDIINSKIVESLHELGINNVTLKGISDIAINDVKILGSALYQNKDVVFYHAVLNVSESTDLMERYIKHPTREPDYRKNRIHSEFVTSIVNENYNIDKRLIIRTLENHLHKISFP